MTPRKSRTPNVGGGISKPTPRPGPATSAIPAKRSADGDLAQVRSVKDVVREFTAMASASALADPFIKAETTEPREGVLKTIGWIPFEKSEWKYGNDEGRDLCSDDEDEDFSSLSAMTRVPKTDYRAQWEAAKEREEAARQKTRAAMRAPKSKVSKKKTRTATSAINSERPSSGKAHAEAVASFKPPVTDYRTPRKATKTNTRSLETKTTEVKKSTEGTEVLPTAQTATELKTSEPAQKVSNSDDELVDWKAKFEQLQKEQTEKDGDEWRRREDAILGVRMEYTAQLHAKNHQLAAKDTELVKKDAELSVEKAELNEKKMELVAKEADLVAKKAKLKPLETAYTEALVLAVKKEEEENTLLNRQDEELTRLRLKDQALLMERQTRRGEVRSATELLIRTGYLSDKGHA